LYYALSVKIRQDMENNSDLTQALKDIKNVANNDSWFRDDPHRWASASLPLAYAIACVEVVVNSSEKAGAIYSQIIEACGKPGVKAFLLLNISRR